VKRVLVGVLLAAAGFAYVAAPSERSPAEQYEAGRSLLEERIGRLRTRTSEAAKRMAAWGDRDARSLFAEADALLERTGVDGVALLDDGGAAIAWAGRTFEMNLQLALPELRQGLTVQSILDHPAHHVLYTIKPADAGRYAVAFAKFDERFPVRRDLGEAIAREAGLFEVELRYASGDVPVDPQSTRPFKSTVIAGLVHATFYAKEPHESRADARVESARRLRITAAIALTLLFLLVRRRPGALALYLALLTPLAWEHRPLAAALAGGAALALAWELSARARSAWVGAAAVGGLIALGPFVRWIAVVGEAHALFDPTTSVPHDGAALLLAGAALATLAVVRLAASALRVRWPRGRIERVLVAGALTASLLLPILHMEHARADRQALVDSTRELLDPTTDSEAGVRLDRAVNTATDPQRGANREIAAELASDGDPQGLAFELWAASGWDPRDPCAVEIYDAGLARVSSFDLDAPPADLLPAPPDSIAPRSLRLAGQGAGSAIRFRVRDLPLYASADDPQPVGLARFLMPVRWDLMRTDLRPPIFNEADSVRVRAELDPSGRALFVSDGSPDDLPRVAPEAGEYPIRYRGRPARMLVVPSGDRIAAVVTLTSLGDELFFEAAHLLAIIGIGCLLYAAWNWKRMDWAFRHTIALFLAAVSFVPVAIIGMNQGSVLERRYEARINAGLRRGVELASALLRGHEDAVDNAWAIEVSKIHRIDVNVYEGAALVATSRPGVWDTGLLSRRLAAPAYEALVLRKQHQYIGREPFIGTGDLRSGYQRIDGDRIVATPSLSDRTELDQQKAEEQARLSAVYVLAAALAALLSLPVSYLLMRPVRKLQGVTREVAAGNLSVELPRARGRGELGELVRSFERMTRDLRDAQELQARAERAAAWREMAQQIAHDVKNPLTPMKLTIQNLLALQKEAPDLFEEEFERGSRLILEQIDQLQRIAGNFSSFARMPARHPEPVDVAALLREIAELHGAAGAIEVDVGDAALVVRADRDELSRVLHNLLSNAREAQAQTIRMRGAREGAHVRIDVRDDGRGIDPASMDRIFEPSFTTRTRGTGLGLPIVKRIVDDLGGTVEIESEPGNGTRVTLRLPAADGTNQTA